MWTLTFGGGENLRGNSKSLGVGDGRNSFNLNFDQYGNHLTGFNISVLSTSIPIVGRSGVSEVLTDTDTESYFRSKRK